MKKLIPLHFVGTLLSIFFFSNIAKAQIITTIAGNGVNGYYGDGGPATAAEFDIPASGEADDAAGNLYVVDYENLRVRVINSSGIINTFAGTGLGGFSGDGGPATAAELHFASAVTEDPSGNAYIVDSHNERIRVVNTSGIINTIAGNGSMGYSGDGGPATAAEFNTPGSIALDASGNIYVTDELNYCVRKINTSGIISTFAGNGVAGYSGDGGAATAAELYYPNSVAVDASGNVYVSDPSNYRIRMVNTSGIISTFAGNGTNGYSGDGGAATAAEVYNPGAVVVDGSGNLYFGDAYRIRKVNTSGTITTFAGDGASGFSGDEGQATAAQIEGANGLTLDESGNIYFPDGDRIREVYMSLDVSATLIANISCPGGDNGSASASATHGTTPYTYSWAPGGETTSTATGLSAGTYTVTVTDANSITGSASVVIKQPSAAIAITPTLTMPSITDYLFGAGDSVQWFTFTAPYSRLTIELDPPVNAADTPRAYIDSLIIYKGSSCSSLVEVAYRTAARGSDTLPSIQMLNFVTGATYYVKVTRYDLGIRGCHLCPAYVGLDPIQLAAPLIPNDLACLTTCGPNLLCNGNFEDWSSTPYISGPTCYQDESYTWPSNPPVTPYCIQSPNMRYGTGCTLLPTPISDYTDIYLITTILPPAVSGNFLMLVDSPSDACIACSTYSPPGPILTPNYTCIPWEEEPATIPQATYQFSCWLRDASFAVSPLPAAATASITVNGNLEYRDQVNYVSWTNVAFCWSDNSSNADLQISGQGASDVYGYDWEIDSVTYALVSLPTITYSSYTICTGSSVTLTPNIISPLLTYTWAPATGLNNINIGDPIASPTVTTIYTCDIGTLQGTCTTTATCTVTVNSSPTVTISSVNVLCNGNSTGSATASVTGGSPVFTYSWSNAATTANIAGLSAGGYTVTVTDENGCTGTTSVTITQPPPLNVSVSGSYSGCGGEHNGSATATATGGTPVYTYSWSSPGGSNANISGLSAGTYTITVTDANNCLTSASVVITQPNPLIVAASVTATIACNGGNNGSVTASVTGGQSPYTYSWTTSPVQITATATGLSAGSYTVTVTDNIGCTGTASVIITQPPLLTVTASVTANVSCYGLSNGSATASATGGTPAYMYSWSNGVTTSNIAGLSAGGYTITVTDANGCTGTAGVTITQPSQLVASVPSATVCPSGGTTGGSTGGGGPVVATLTVTPSGGTPAYTYSWNPGGQTTATVSGLSVGTYTVTVTDANGCSATALGVVYQDNLTVTSTSLVVCPRTVANTATLTATPSGGVPAYTYYWSPSAETTQTATGLTTGTYTVTVTDAVGCMATAIGIVSLDNLAASITNYLPGSGVACTTSTNPGNEYCPSASGGVGPYTYSWIATTGTVTPAITPTTCVNVAWANPNVTEYLTLIVTDNIGCQATATDTIRVCCAPPALVACAIGTYTVNALSTFTLSQAGPVITKMASPGPGWVFSGFAPGSSLAIDGTVDLLYDMTIDCSDVLMGPGAQIIVENGITLYINNSHLHACTDMWNDIDVKPGGNVRIIGSLIEDAQTAVYAEDGPLATDLSKFYLFQTIFNQNKVGVDVEPYAPYLYIAHPGYIGNCTFSSDVSSGIPCDGAKPFTIYPNNNPNNPPVPAAQINPNTPYRGAVGVSIDEVYSITIGDVSPKIINTFIDIDCGINTNSSSVNVYHCNFTNMTTVPGPILNNGGGMKLAGIYAKGVIISSNPFTLNVGNNAGTPYPCNFTRCQYGVFVRDTINANIQHNNFEGFKVGYSGPIPNPCYGVYLLDNESSLTVSNNPTINDYQVGVYAIYNLGSPVTISNNPSIQSNNNWKTGSWGIEMIEPNYSYNANGYTASKNTITGVANGIACVTLSKPYILDNNITITGLGNPTNYGIDLEDCFASDVKSNTVTYNNGKTLNTTGIELNMGFAIEQLKCNLLQGSYTGISIQGPQLPIYIEENNMILPVSCSAYGINLNGSGFIGKYPPTVTNTWNIGCSHSCPMQYATNSGLLGNGFFVPNTGCTIDPTTNFNFGGLTRVTFSVSGTDSYGCGSPLSPAAPRPSPHSALSAINDSVAYVLYPQTSNWTAKYGLSYYMYMVDSSLVDSSTVIKHFFDTTQASNMGKIIKTGKLLADTNGVSGADISAARSLNNSLVSPDTAEATYQSIYKVIISIDSVGGTLIPTIPSEVTILKSIAPRCPLEYGGAVFMARALLSQIDTTKYINTCEITNKDSVTAPPLCTDSNPASILIHNQAASYFGGPYTRDTLKTLYINGRYTIDHAVTLRGCNVNFGTGGQIIINSGDTLTLTSYGSTCTHLHAGCGNMWSSIHIMPGGTLIANNGTLIEDADTAIYAAPGGSSSEAIYQLNGIVLNKNHVDIYIGAYSHKYNGYADNCIFTCRNLTPCSYTNWLTADTIRLLPPYSGFRTLVGMSLNQVDTIDVGTQNSFDNMDAGIYTFNGNTTVRKDTFENIATSIDENSGAFLSGIYAMEQDSLYSISACASTGYNLIVGGSGNSNVFRNCKYGVWARDTINATVSYNSFAMNAAGIEDGVVLYSNAYSNCLVSHNTMSNAYAGVFCYRNQFGNIRVSNNTITGSASLHRSYGIEVFEGPANPYTHYAIDSNTIGNTTNGIFTMMLEHSLVYGNNITVNGKGNTPLDNEGMYFAAPFEDVINENTVNDTNTDGADGIRIEGGKGSNSITCNSLTNVINGMVFGGTQSPNTFMDQNYLHGFHSGLYLHTSGDIGGQGTMTNGTTNTWNPYNDTVAPPYATFVDSSSNPDGATHFNVGGVSGSIYPYPDLVMNYVQGSHAKRVSFTPGGGTDCFNCLSASCVMDNVDTVLAARIIRDSANYTLYRSASHWLEKHALYKYFLQVDSALVASYPTAKRFLDTTEASKMGMLEQINTLLTDSTGISISDNNRAVLLSLAVYAALPDTVEATAQAVLDAANLTELLGLTTPDGLDKSILQQYAPLCPYQYGTGVYLARALLAPIDSTDYYSTCEEIYGNGRAYAHRPVKKPASTQTTVPDNKSLTVKVYPNPANTLLNVEFIGQQMTGTIYLYNGLGQLTLTYSLTSNLTTIPVGSLAQGIYHYRIIDNNQKPVKTDNLLIER